MFVLFVDQNVQAMAEMEQALIALGCDWEIECVSSPATALAICESRPVDLVVTDQHLPMMHGAVLLREVRARRPEAMRILLSNGARDDETAMRALDIAHRTMKKPCQPHDIIAVADRMLALREILRDGRLRELFGGIASLPAAPSVYLALTTALEHGETDSRRIAALIGEDPSLVAQVLRLSNSAMLAGREPVRDIIGAVTRVGLRLVRNVVLAAEAFKPVPGVTLDIDRLQARALVASTIAPQLLDDPAEGAVAATAALLAEVGRMLPSPKIRRASADDVGAVADASPAPSPAEAGAYLLGLWGLPMNIVECVAFQQTPQRVESTRCGTVGAVHIAIALAAGTMPDAEFVERCGMAARVESVRANLAGKRAA